MPTISIVVPVYNVEPYLALCVESIRKQSYEDIEIICVDDGSTDGSRDVLALFEAVEPRLRVLDQPNRGVSAARNAGIKSATGDIVCFLDSDDMLEERACEVLAQTFAASHAEVVTYGASIYPEFRSYWWLNHVLSPRDITYDGFAPALLFEESSRPFPWRTACTREFLEKTDVLFDEGLSLGEDQVFHFALYPRSAKTVLIADKLVKYRVSRKGSLVSSSLVDTPGRIKTHVAVVQRICEDWAQAGFLDVYTDELFAWTIEFVALDVIALEAEEKETAASLLHRVWQCYFDEACLGNAERSRRYGHLVRFVRAEGRGAIDERRARFRYYACAYGYLDAAKRLGRWVRDRIWGRLVRAVRRSSSATDAGGVSLDEQWEREDEAEREGALETLRREAACGKTQQ